MQHCLFQHICSICAGPLPQDAFDWPSNISRMYKIRSSPRFLFFVDVSTAAAACECSHEGSPEGYLSLVMMAAACTACMHGCPHVVWACAGMPHAWLL